uniref:Putative product n=1 Tax=Xenopsylla cheopis TaxID=163159 RepID=A0A6M2DXS7_XENCH
MKAIRVVMLTTGSFALTWMPYFIACAIYVNCDHDLSKQTEFCNNLSVAIASPLALLGFGNSFLNPFIYAWWHRGFRRALCKTSKNKSSRFTNRNLQYYRSTLDNNQTILTRIVSSKSRFTCSRTES